MIRKREHMDNKVGLALVPGPQESIEADRERVAAHVEFFYGRDGVQPGAWENTLMTLIAHADRENRERLRGAFPVYVAAMEAGRLVGPLVPGVSR